MADDYVQDMLDSIDSLYDPTYDEDIILVVTKYDGSKADQDKIYEITHHIIMEERKFPIFAHWFREMECGSGGKEKEYAHYFQLLLFRQMFLHRLACGELRIYSPFPDLDCLSTGEKDFIHSAGYAGFTFGIYDEHMESISYENEGNTDMLSENGWKLYNIYQSGREDEDQETIYEEAFKAYDSGMEKLLGQCVKVDIDIRIGDNFGKNQERIAEVNCGHFADIKLVHPDTPIWPRVYVAGVDSPVTQYEGKVIALVKDISLSYISAVVGNDVVYTKEDIKTLLESQEYNWEMKTVIMESDF